MGRPAASGGWAGGIAPQTNGLCPTKEFARAPPPFSETQVGKLRKALNNEKKKLHKTL